MFLFLHKPLEYVGGKMDNFTWNFTPVSLRGWGWGWLLRTGDKLKTLNY